MCILAGKSNCDCCASYVFDDEYGYYRCDVNLDEDELEHSLRGTLDHCPYYQPYDEYKIVQKQN